MSFLNKNTILLIIIVIFSGSAGFYMVKNQVPRNDPSKWTGIVTITFDDGSKTVYNSAYPIMKKYNIPATFYLTAGSIGKNEFVTWDDVNDLNKNGWEIASHTVNHPHLNTLTRNQAIAELVGAKDIFAQHGYNVTSFAAPYGQYTSNILALIEEYYQSNRKNQIRGNPGINHLDKLNNYGLSSYEVGQSSTISVVKERINQAINQKGWLIIYFHSVNEDPTTRFEIKEKNMQEIMSYIAQKRDQGQIQVKTVDQVVSMYPKPNLD
ncbi:MAG: polysaccharide deacetylase family protein [Candidatus Berkelbacteria bacterium]